ncbi:MAG TPA: hypothetical protein VJK72_05645 [Candidatus Nanoarchaeia archaeon]|nr:hypothetical protein [Candidatus Nanoarchaeia archaeon]
MNKISNIIILILLVSFTASFFVTSYNVVQVIGNTIVDTWSVIDGWATSGTVGIAINIISNIDTENNVVVPDSGNLSFSNPNINADITKVTHLTSKCIINATLYGKSFPSAWSQREPNATEAGTKIEYFDMNYNCTLSELCRIYFNLSSSAMGALNASNISLFFYNTSTTNWDNLSTNVINNTNDPREFFAFVPHFTDFLIAQNLQVAGGGSDDDDEDSGGSPGGGGNTGGGGGSSSGGGESGGAAGGEAKKVSFIVSPSKITATLNQDQIYSSSIGIINTESVPLTFQLTVTGDVKELVTLEQDSVTLEAGEESIVGLTVFAKVKATKIFTGKIVVQAEGVQKSIPIIIGLKASDALFDISVDADESLQAGTIFPVSIHLQNIGLRGVPVDVELEVYLTDMEKNTLTPLFGETIAVSTFLSMRRELVLRPTVSAGYYLIVAKGTYDGKFIEAFDSVRVLKSEKPYVTEKAVSNKILLYLVGVFGFLAFAAILVILHTKLNRVKFIKRKTIVPQKVVRRQPAKTSSDDYWEEMQRRIR